jgi:hypothetical protein
VFEHVWFAPGGDPAEQGRAYEGGFVGIPSSTLQRLAKAVRVPVAALLE